MMQDNLFTAGELAKMAGVSLRTIRFYDIKGLLCPVAYSDSGYRLYNQQSFAVLQHILMLKYLGFSLQQISDVISNKNDIKEHLGQQRKLLAEKMDNLQKMISTIDLVQNSSGDEQWNALLHLVNLMTEDEKTIEQYKSPSNLEKRINIHSYSTNPQNWYDWVYERLEIQEGQNILEIGCGNARLWAANAHRLPRNIEITLTDRSEGMLSEAKKQLDPFHNLFVSSNIRVNYQLADANKLVLPKHAYDLVVANHMLYHVTDLEACLSAISGAVKKKGIFCCSTIGKNHMKELHELVGSLDSDIVIEIPSNHHATKFRLENGMEFLDKHFNSVKKEIQDNALVVDDVDAIYNYVHSYSGNAPYILERHEAVFREMLQERIEKEGAIYIQKSTGMFICRRA